MHGIDIVIYGNESSNTLFMTCWEHTSRSYSEKCRCDDHDTESAISHNTLPIRLLSHKKVL